jgi:phytol kinase
MAAAAWPGAAAACASSSNSLLPSRSRPHAPSPASFMRRRLVPGVANPAMAALAAAAPPAVLQDGAATLFTTAGAYALVRTFDVLTERRLVEKVSSLTILPVFLLVSNKVLAQSVVLCLERNRGFVWRCVVISYPIY